MGGDRRATSLGGEGGVGVGSSERTVGPTPGTSTGRVRLNDIRGRKFGVPKEFPLRSRELIVK